MRNLLNVFTQQWRSGCESNFRERQRESDVLLSCHCTTVPQADTLA